MQNSGKGRPELLPQHSQRSWTFFHKSIREASKRRKDLTYEYISGAGGAIDSGESAKVWEGLFAGATVAALLPQ